MGPSKDAPEFPSPMPPSTIPFRWKHLLPREHGLWSWVGLPWVGALLLAPSVSTVLGVLAGLALCGGGMAASRGSGREARWVVLLAGLLGWGAMALSPHPSFLAWTWLGMAAGGGGVLVLRERLSHHSPGTYTSLELLVIHGAGLSGAGLAMAGGVPPSRALLMALALCTWQVIGLWWVRGKLARVLPRREPWQRGPWFIVSCTALLMGFSWAEGRLALAILPFLYGLRIATSPPVNGARDSRRLGLSEGAWALAAVTLVGWVAR